MARFTARTRSRRPTSARSSFAFRVFVDGFQHAVWAGVSGFFVGMAVNYRRRRIPLLLLGISIPAILHALNDWTLTIFSTVWVGRALIQAVSLLLFLGYTLSASEHRTQGPQEPELPRPVDHDGALQPA